MISRIVPALSLALAVAAPAAATVLTEADGSFSRHWHSPTAVGQGVETILGTVEKQNTREFLALTGLRPGAQTLSFVFTAPDWALSSYSYSAGGQVLWSTSPFHHEWDGTGAGAFQLSRWMPQGTLDLALGEDFHGPLYLGIYTTHGRDVAWSIAASSPESVPEVAAVPLPAPAAHVAVGLSLLAGLGLRGASGLRKPR